MAICSPQALAKCIDHTLLRPEASADDIRRLCAEARAYGFASVCVQPVRVALAVQELENTGIAVGTVIGFPHGASGTAVKVYEVERAQEKGASEFDMVIDLGAVQDGDWQLVATEVQQVAKRVHATGGVLKVILECALLNADQKRHAAEVALEGGADYLKTSTGFASGGATIEDVRLLRQVAGERCKVKAAGGIRTWRAALAMLEAGADRIGCSASVMIMEEALQAFDQTAL
ncbi:deoxyribose-phosphate aldolase [Chthonomonas calidirosea]|uniref:Deoxyribose-phosphate aldolase n=1 Tax=Chthonomonas calidirosea (strain DSM 23976 / ICMP 18418 / T49) TaxID=1303518 RepID=S0F032_CHTCT|nr:deoxyribose-phosphate aldolase [Chthonomonas calidirosea]CCW36417.1 deoxyribose-phosphate aldolase [Chthonomonas calidirosea T49]CEK17398.1 deoxyribose-phosphate aldolase [Chthonomonas calidirosea]